MSFFHKPEAKNREISKENARSKMRSDIYLALVVMLVIGLIDTLIPSLSARPKIAVQEPILVALRSQFIHQQRISSEIERTVKEKAGRQKASPLVSLQ